MDETKLPSLDPGRLETEVTLFADRCCIDEEADKAVRVISSGLGRLWT
ncbi:MAG: hypothetical protein ACLR23_04780 [Clostridia bacterium]